MEEIIKTILITNIKYFVKEYSYLINEYFYGLATLEDESKSITICTQQIVYFNSKGGFGYPEKNYKDCSLEELHKILKDISEEIFSLNRCKRDYRIGRK